MIKWFKSLFGSKAPAPKVVTVKPKPTPAVTPTPQPISSNFEFAFKYTSPDEGGYVNNPADKGGPTNFGITQATLSKWRGYKVSVQEVKDMSLSEAKEIFKAEYWDVIKLDQIKDQSIACVIYNQSVNSGPGTGVKLATQALKLSSSTSMTPGLIATLNSVPRSPFINPYADACISRYQSIARWSLSQKQFLAGWIARANRYRKLI